MSIYMEESMLEKAMFSLRLDDPEEDLTMGSSDNCSSVLRWVSRAEWQESDLGLEIERETLLSEGSEGWLNEWTCPDDESLPESGSLPEAVSLPEARSIYKRFKPGRAPGTTTDLVGRWEIRIEREVKQLEEIEEKRPRRSERLRREVQAGEPGQESIAYFIRRAAGSKGRERPAKRAASRQDILRDSGGRSSTIPKNYLKGLNSSKKPLQFCLKLLSEAPFQLQRKLMESQPYQTIIKNKISDPIPTTARKEIIKEIKLYFNCC